MPHAIVATTTPTEEEFYDSELPTTLMPPRRVYRPLAATFFETERQVGSSHPSSPSVIPVSVSKYIKSLSSTVESFAGELCDDPAIQSVLNCRRQKTGVEAAPAIQSSYSASLSAGPSYISATGTLPSNTKGPSEENCKRGFQYYPPSIKESKLQSVFQRVHDSPQISSSGVSLYVRDKSSYTAQNTAAFYTSMAENPNQVLRNHFELTKSFDTGSKRDSCYFAHESVPRRRSRKRTRLSHDCHVNIGKEMFVSTHVYTDHLRGVSTVEECRLSGRRGANFGVLGEDGPLHEVSSGNSWGSLVVNPTRDDRIAATLAIAKDAELKISINCKEDLETPCISNLMRLACAAGLARIAQTSKESLSELNHMEEPAQIF